MRFIVIKRFTESVKPSFSLELRFAEFKFSENGFSKKRLLTANTATQCSNTQRALAMRLVCVNLLPTCCNLASNLLKLATYLLLAIKLASGSKIAIPFNAPSIFNPSYNCSYK